MTNEQSARRKRGAWLGLLPLLLALGGAGYALTSPSASTGSGKSPASPSGQVVLAPAASGNNGNGSGGNDNCVEPSNGNGNCVKTFGVRVGETPLLYPTVTRNLPVTYSNPNSFDIEVATYRVSVSVPSSTATVCPASSLSVPAGTVTLSPRIVLPKKGSAVTTIPIRLGADAPEACKDVTFSITIDATAVKK